MKLESSVKGHQADQDKVTDPASTVEHALGKLAEMGDLEQVDIAFREHAIDGAYCFHSLSNIFNASGKGLTPEQAQASATMEFSERYSWFHYDYEQARGYTQRSHADLLADGANVPDAAEYFLANFPNLPGREQVLEELVTIPLKWVLGWSFTDDAEIHYPVNWHNMVFTSNGLAAGNTIEEAIGQATCEVIERENIFRFFVEKRPAATVDQESISNPLLKEALREARERGIEFVLKDISSDLGVPTFVARGTRAGHEGELTWQGVGHGTHPHPEKALIRAVSEYFEGFAAVTEFPADVDLEVLRTILPPHHYGFNALLNPEMFEVDGGVRRLDDMEDLSLPDIKDEVERLVEILRARDFKLYVVDKTFEPLGIPTVRVISPGMRNCVNNDIVSPEFAISEVWHEAGDSRAAMEHMVKSIMSSPFMKLLRGRMSNMLAVVLPTMTTFDSNMVYKGDYRDALKNVGFLKKGGLGTLERLGSVRDLLKQGGLAL